jgi:hypothetical protein
MIQLRGALAKGYRHASEPSLERITIFFIGRSKMEVKVPFGSGQLAVKGL